MPNQADDWFSPAPSAVSFSRLVLDFGLRAADLFFRELVVPELGQVWFVRQLSWPLAAFALIKSWLIKSQTRHAQKRLDQSGRTYRSLLRYLSSPVS